MWGRLKGRRGVDVRSMWGGYIEDKQIKRRLRSQQVYVHVPFIYYITTYLFSFVETPRKFIIYVVFPQS